MKRKKIVTTAASIAMSAVIAGTSVPVAPVFASETETVSDAEIGVPSTEAPGDDLPEPDDMPLEDAPEGDPEDDTTEETAPEVVDGITMSYGNTEEALEEDMSVRDFIFVLLGKLGSGVSADDVYLDMVNNTGKRTIVLSEADDSVLELMVLSELCDLVESQSDVSLILYTNSREIGRFGVSYADRQLDVEKLAEDTFEVTYDANGGDLSTSFTSVRASGEAISHIDVSASWDRHEFLGWFDSLADDANPVTEDTVVTGNMTVYAKWDAESYTLSFDSQGGSEVASRTVDFDVPAADFEEPVKDGYTFLGWFTSPDGGDQVASVTLDSSDMTLYAHWKEIEMEPVSYTVVLDDGMGNMTPIVVPYGTSFAEFPTPEREGYTFAGWFDAAEGGNQVSVYDGNADVNFYAHWIENPEEIQIPYVVTLDDQNGNVSRNEMDAGTTFTAFPTLARDGYTFLGWFDAPEGGNQVTSYAGNKDVTFYAQWESNVPVKTSHVITLDDQNGTVTPYEVEDGTMFSSFPTLGREGYMFLGWFDAPEGGKQVYSYKGIEDVTFYAHWKTIDPEEATYVVILDDGMGGITEQTMNVGTTFTSFPELTRDGYTFLGWFDAVEGGNQVTSYDGVESATFYAQWKEADGETPIEKAPFVISMRQNGSTGTIDVKPGDEVTYAVTVRNGSESEVKNIVATMQLPEGLEYVSSRITENNYESAVHWEYAQTSYSAAEHTLTMIPARYRHDTTGTLASNRVVSFEVVLKVKENVSGEFSTGMQVAYGDNQTQDAAGLVLNVTDPVAEQVTITLDDQNGNVTTETVEKDSVFDMFGILKRDGYEFLGWFDAKTGGNKVTSYTAVADAVFYAQWKEADGETPSVITITLDDQNGTVTPHEVEAGSMFTDFPAPTRDGYTFLGWFDAREGGNQVTSYAGTESATFYGQWKKNEETTEPTTVTYKLTLDDQNGNVNTYTVKEGESMTLPTPTRDGYTFLGWFDAREGGNQVASYTGNGDTVLYAQWKEAEPGDTEVKVTSLKLNKNEVTVNMSKNEKLGLTFSYGPKGATNAQFTWTSSNPNVIEVLQTKCDDGTVKYSFEYRGAGETTLTVSTVDGSISDSCKVTVTKDEDSQPQTEPVTEPAQTEPTPTPGTENGSTTPTPTPSTEAAVTRYTLTVVSTTGTTQSVTVNSDVKLSDLAEKLGYNTISTFTVTQSGVKEYTVDGSMTMKQLADLAENGDVLIIGYDSAGKAVGSAKVTKTGEGTYTVTLSKDTNIPLKGKGEGEPESETEKKDEGSGSGSSGVSNDGKGDSVAQTVKTGDVDTVATFGAMGGIAAVLLGILAFLKKKKLV